MIEFTINKGLKKTRIKLYNDIDQLPIERFNKANKYWMLHDNIGSSIEDFDRNHFQKIILLAGDKQKCIKELTNLRILIYNIMNETNVQQLSFACLIYSINGQELTDLSEENLRNILNDLGKCGLTQGILKKKLQRQEKKFIRI